MISKTKPGMCRAHHVQFYNLMPRTITNLAFNKNNSKLAVSRDEGSIEIWNMTENPFMEKCILGGENVSVEGIAWAGERLFSIGLSGTLIEWDLKRLEPKNTVLTTGNAAWCIDVSKDETKIAIGTEGGYINVYNLDDDSINYEKILDKQEGRIVCCKFDHSGDFLVTGSADAVRVWNIKNGHAIQKMTTGRPDPTKKTIVWCVEVLKDFTIISGDSRGKLSFYDGNLGAMVESISISKADILALTLDDEEKNLYLTGVEPIIRCFQRINYVKNADKMAGFVRSLNKQVHTHDTNAMIMNGNQLISGGVDGYLVISSYPPKRVNRYSPYLESPSTIVAEESRLVLLKYVNYLEVWKLGNASYSTEDHLNLEQGSEKILQIRSKRDEHILCSSISSDGKWIIYSTETTIRLFRQVLQDYGPPKLIQIKAVPDQFSVCNRVEFTKNSRGVFLFKKEAVVDYFAFNQNDDFDHKQTIEIGKSIQDKVHLVAIDKDDTYLVLAGLCKAISVWKKEKSGKWKHSINLPKYKLPATAIAIQPRSTVLAAVFPDNKIFHYDLEEFEFKFSSFLNDSESRDVVQNIVFDPRNEDCMLLQRNNSVQVFKFNNEDDQNEKEAEEKKTNKEVSTFRSYTVRELKKYAHLVHIQWMGVDEFVAIETNPVSMTEHLPAAFRMKKFGQS